MSSMKQILRTFLVVMGVLQFAACSKTVQWEEEVPLNTGETIWVMREVTYKLKGGGDNPLDMAYRPDWTEAISFKWRGKEYRHVGDANLMLLAISPLTQQPVLVAGAGMKDWDYRNNYRCTIPFYVQFVPSESGQTWTWPSAIEPWLFNLPYNLMYNRADINKVLKKYTIEDRVKADDGVIHDSPSLVQINPHAKSESCFK